MHSTFPFEDTNGWLGDLFNGTNNPDKQVWNNIHIAYIPCIGRVSIVRFFRLQIVTFSMIYNQKMGCALPCILCTPINVMYIAIIIDCNNIVDCEIIS